MATSLQEALKKAEEERARAEQKVARLQELIAAAAEGSSSSSSSSSAAAAPSSSSSAAAAVAAANPVVDLTKMSGAEESEDEDTGDGAAAAQSKPTDNYYQWNPNWSLPSPSDSARLAHIRAKHRAFLKKWYALAPEIANLEDQLMNKYRLQEHKSDPVAVAELEEQLRELRVEHRHEVGMHIGGMWYPTFRSEKKVWKERVIQLYKNPVVQQWWKTKRDAEEAARVAKVKALKDKGEQTLAQKISKIRPGTPWSVKLLGPLNYYEEQALEKRPKINAKFVVGCFYLVKQWGNYGKLYLYLVRVTGFTTSGKSLYRKLRRIDIGDRHPTRVNYRKDVTYTFEDNNKREGTAHRLSTMVGLSTEDYFADANGVDAFGKKVVNIVYSNAEELKAWINEPAVTASGSSSSGAASANKRTGGAGGSPKKRQKNFFQDLRF